MDSIFLDWMIARLKEPTSWVGFIGYVLGGLNLGFTVPESVVGNIAAIVAFVSSTLLIVMKQKFKG